MIVRDEFYSKLLDNSGNIEVGKVGDRLVSLWDGVNPVLMSQELFNNLDWDSPDIEALPNHSFRICQYRFEHVQTYPKYNIIAFEIDEFPNEGVPQEYRDRLVEWKAYQEIT